MIGSPARRSTGLAALVAATPVRLATALFQRLIDHPFEIDRLDASAGSLWPRTPEEPQPPRWQVDRLDRPRRRPAHGPSPQVVATGRPSAIPSCR
jgi:hypothetical protein